MKTIFAESSVNPKVEEAIAREAGARIGAELWADSLGPEGSDGATYIALDRGQHARAGRRLQRRCGRLPRSMPDLSAPYIQRGIVEILLLAVLAGVLGTWVVLRRLPFYTHAIGTATFPGWSSPARGGCRRS